VAVLSQLSQTGHGGAITVHVALAGELSAHGATQGGIVGEEAGVVHAPYDFLLLSNLDVGECCVFVVEFEVGFILRGTGEEGTVFSGV
jgi:hypothetical protein